jgi:hypothetical protein
MRATNIRMTYTDTFIRIAPGCPAGSGIIPIARGKNVPFCITEYELLSKHPYVYTKEELIIEAHLQRKTITKAELEAGGESLAAKLQRRNPCMRTSALPKKYGWGFHFDSQGKLALYAVDSKEYQQFIHPDSGLQVLSALRSKRE